MKLPDKNRLEWVVFAVSAVLIAAVLGTLVRFEASRPDTPPELSVRVTGARASGDGYAVTVEVENRGGEAATGVGIEVELRGAVPERGQLELPVVPHAAIRTGEVMASSSPASSRPPPSR